jgi:hypothetical protein
MSLLKVYLRLVFYVLYVTDEGLLKIITVRVVVADGCLPKIIIFRDVCH